MGKRSRQVRAAKKWEKVAPAYPKQSERFRALQKESEAAGEWLTIWGNDRYTVHVRCSIEKGMSGLVHLSIHRRDRAPARDWRDFQRIKNDVCGPEREAIELYPAESRLVDQANEYHLWVAPEGERLPVGVDVGRLVGTPEEAAAIGATQRALDEE